ncbi:MAG: imidazole glycerol phosphate synthase subunit HisH [Myxococcota bacterium]
MNSEAPVIVDLGLGNLGSVARAFGRAGCRAMVTSDPERITNARRIVVPGQGGFRDCAVALEGDLGCALRRHLEQGKPFFGICLGMQMLFEESEEAPGKRGLGRLAGRVRRFSGELRDSETGKALKVPHIGWNQVRSRHSFMPEEDWYYFVHSYHCVPDRAAQVVATTRYEGDVCAAVAEGNLFACQFHPEKSYLQGQELLRRFLAA